MDLEALPPEDPAAASAADGSPEPAPWAAAATDAAGGWLPPAETAAQPTARRLGLSRSTRILSGAVALSVVATGAWAAGAALHSSSPTVKFQPAASTAAAATGGTGAAGTAPTGPVPHRRFGFGGGAGVVASVDPSAPSFAVTVPTRPVAPATPGAAPTTPTTKTATIKVTSATTYLLTEQGTSGDIATGMRILAMGTANTDGTLAATAVEVVQAGIGPAGPKPPAAPTTPGAAPVNPNAPVRPGLPANAPFAVGTVKSVTTGSAGALSVVVSSPRGDRTVMVSSTTTVTKTVKATFGDVKVGDTVLARGQHNTDGSVSATAVQIVAAGLKAPGKFGFGRGPGSGFGPGFGFGPGWGFGGRGHGPGGFGGRGPKGQETGGSTPPAAGQAATTAGTTI
jgi:hypothetical protein